MAMIMALLANSFCSLTVSFIDKLVDKTILLKLYGMDGLSTLSKLYIKLQSALNERFDEAM